MLALMPRSVVGPRPDREDGSRRPACLAAHLLTRLYCHRALADVEDSLLLCVRALRGLGIRADWHAAACAGAEGAYGSRDCPGHDARGVGHAHVRPGGGGHPARDLQRRLRRLHHPRDRPGSPGCHHWHPRGPRRELSVRLFRRLGRLKAGITLFLHHMTRVRTEGAIERVSVVVDSFSRVPRVFLPRAE
ncbi:hypothetical protein Ctob_011662, partial [Chrysochromulina tobinii]